MENQTGTACVLTDGSGTHDNLTLSFSPSTQPSYLTDDARIQAENSLILSDPLMQQIDHLLCNQDLQQMLDGSISETGQTGVWSKKLVLELLAGNWPAECAGALCVLLALLSALLALFLACRRTAAPSLESPTPRQLHCSSFKRAVCSLLLFLLVCFVFFISVSIVAISSMTRVIAWQQGHSVQWAVIDTQKALQTATGDLVDLVYQHRLTVSRKIKRHVQEQLEGGYDSLLSELAEKSAVSDTISEMQYLDQSMKELNFLVLTLREKISEVAHTNKSAPSDHGSDKHQSLSSCPEIGSSQEALLVCWETYKTSNHKHTTLQILSLLQATSKAIETFYTEESEIIYNSLQNSFIESTKNYMYILQNLNKELELVLHEHNDQLQTSIVEVKSSVDKIGQNLSRTAAEINQTPLAIWAQRLATLMWTWTLTVPLLSILAVLKLLAALAAAYFPSTSSLRPHYHTINTLRCGICVLGIVSVSVWISTAIAVILASFSGSLLCPRDCTNGSSPNHMAAVNRFLIGSDLSPFQPIQSQITDVLRSCQSDYGVFEAFNITSVDRVWRLSELPMQNTISVPFLFNAEREEFSTITVQIRSHLIFVDKISSLNFSMLEKQDGFNAIGNKLAAVQLDLKHKADHVRNLTVVTDNFAEMNASAILNQEMITLRTEISRMARHYLRDSFNMATERRHCQTIIKAFEFVESSACDYFPGSLHVLWLCLAALGCLLLPTMLVTSCQLHLLHQHQHFLLLNTSNSPRPCLWQNLSDETLRCSRRGSGSEEVIVFTP